MRDGEREVRDIIAGREKDERAISLATPYYDVVRQKHGESDEEAEETNEVAVDYLTQFMPLVTGTRTMNRQEALEVREKSLKVRAATVPCNLTSSLMSSCFVVMLADASQACINVAIWSLVWLIACECWPSSCCSRLPSVNP